MLEQQAYTLLGVTPNTPLPAIRKAYRKLALQHHPDRNPDDPKARWRFQDLVTAWHLIEDSIAGKRARKPPTDRDRFCQNIRLDIVVPITVSTLQAAEGTSIRMPLAACAADRVRVRANVCRACGGVPTPGICAGCRGVGHVPHTVFGLVDLPPGVQHGMRIRLPGRGLPGRLASPPEPDGDLVLVLTVTGAASPQGPTTALVCEINTSPEEEIVVVSCAVEEPTLEPRGNPYDMLTRLRRGGRW